MTFALEDNTLGEKKSNIIHTPHIIIGKSRKGLSYLLKASLSRENE